MRRHEIIKRFAGLIAVVMLAAGVTAVSALGVASKPAHSSRGGALHVTKVCVYPDFDGKPGSFCTITSSNLSAIGAGSKVFYAEADDPSAAFYDTDLYLYAGPGNSAFGHVKLSNTTGSGVLTLSGGTGRFRGFRARVDVTYDAAADLWHWDGSYRIKSHRH
ncbi:MAG TPA: hypothetical protein VMS55_22115 [Myxococcota bacterium]|nr:hypothetical protein [Myxococcota bacterium]